MRVTIVGAGVIGLSLAWELVQRNIAVRVIERGDSGREASWAASGILPAPGTIQVLDPLERLRALSHSHYPSWAARLKDHTGIDCGLRRCGGLYLAASVGEAASLIANLEYQRELGVELHSLSADQLIELEPELADWARSRVFRAAVLSPDEYQVCPRDLLAALLVACRTSGVVVEEQTTAALQVHNGIASIATTPTTPPDSTVAATTTAAPQVLARSESSLAASGDVTREERFVICGGAWSGQVAASLGLGQSVIPIRGQILMYRYDSAPLTRVINEGHRYLVPREDGRVLIGSCEEEVGFQKGTTPEMLEPLRRWAEALLPSLKERETEQTWSGLRPATFDGFPMMGKVPEVRNLYVAAGHYRSGVHLAPATAMVLADMLTGVTPTVDATAFGVGRLIAHK